MNIWDHREILLPIRRRVFHTIAQGTTREKIRKELRVTILHCSLENQLERKLFEAFAIKRLTPQINNRVGLLTDAHHLEQSWLPWLWHCQLWRTRCSSDSSSSLLLADSALIWLLTSMLVDIMNCIVGLKKVLKLESSPIKGCTQEST